jgi:serine/threonine-protein kinase
MDIRDLCLDHLIGTNLGTCRVVRELGRGSMGVVFLGYQVTLKRPVAIKVLPKEIIVNPLAPKRFVQEAETAAILSHPNIIPIFEIGETEELFFMVMQLVRGMALSTVMERIKKHPVPARRVIPMTDTLEIVHQLLAGLQYAHDEEVIHRDIKPANILLESKTRRVLISDFGIAQELRGEILDDGKVLGTPLYMAPEQARGEEVDHRADIYSVGVVLFEMAAGGLPIYKEPFMKLWERKRNEPLGLFNKRPSEVHQRVDSRLEEIILRAMAFDPDERFQSCEEMSQELRDYKKRQLRARGH